MPINLRDLPKHLRDQLTGTNPIPESRGLTKPRSKPKVTKDTRPVARESYSGVQWQWGAFGGRSHRWYWKANRHSWFTICIRPGFQSQKEPDGCEDRKCRECEQEEVSDG